MINFLKDFRYCGYCNCTGTRNNRYEKDGYIVYHMPKRNQYHIKHNGTYIIKNEPIKTLCLKLKSLGINEDEDCFAHD